MIQSFRTAPGNAQLRTLRDVLLIVLLKLFPTGLETHRRNLYWTSEMNNPIRAYAKINLGLLINDRRSDGYHEIETILHRIDLFDQVMFEKSPIIEIVPRGIEVPTDEGNLCYKAALLLREATGCSEGTRIHLTKNIPVGAGLGGGSSDAAAVLKHLPRFWGFEIAHHDLWRMASQIGSDVPYFLGKGTALGTGRGNILSYIPLEVPFAILVCSPDIHVSTSWAYRELSGRKGGPRIPLRTLLKSLPHESDHFFRNLSNDFEDVVFKRHPEIQEIKRAMLDGGAMTALLSGSGSSVFGVFPESSDATRVSGVLGKKHSGVWITPPFFTAEE